MADQPNEIARLVSEPVKHELIIPSAYVRHFEALFLPGEKEGFYRAPGEAFLAQELRLLYTHPVEGISGPSPDETIVAVEVPNSQVALLLGLYWGRRVALLDQLTGRPDKVRDSLTQQEGGPYDGR